VTCVRIFPILWPDYRPIARANEFPHFASVQAKRNNTTDRKALAQTVEAYCSAHPRGPAAVRRPKLVRRGNLWIALLGSNVQEGIVGIGATVESALRAFDVQYLSSLRPRIAA
jgi:hypothetical protein